MHCKKCNGNGKDRNGQILAQDARRVVAADNDIDAVIFHSFADGNGGVDAVVLNEEVVTILLYNSLRLLDKIL